MTFRRLPRQGLHRSIERLEDRLLLTASSELEPNNSLAQANLIQFTPDDPAQVTGAIGAAGDVDYYTFSISQSGLFTAKTDTPSSNLDSQLTIYGPNQQAIFTSDDRALGNVDPYLQIHLAAGTYWLQVQASPSATAGATTGSYTLSTTFTNASSPFAPQPTGLYSYSIATADLNGDGVLDLVTADNTINQMAVLLGIKLPNSPTAKGDFSYQPVTNVSVGNGPVAIAANLVTSTTPTAKLDFNGDGNADLAVVNSLDNTVEILLGDGQGNFSPGEILNVGNFPSALAVGDFNNDGVADLAVTNSADGTVSIFIGQSDQPGVGNGQFTQVGSAIPIGQPLQNPGDPPVSAPAAIITGDFDGDGKLDLATADSGDNTITVLYGDGQGNFGADANDVNVLQLPDGSQPTSLVAGKFNSKNNSFVGFAVADAATDTVSMILGLENRTFQINDPIVVRQLPQITSASEFNTSVATGDFNGDGLADLVVSNIGDPRVTVALGRGDGTFAPGKQFTSNAGNSPRGIVVADLNGDGRLDFATADNSSNAVFSLFGGRGDGTFLSAPQLQTNQGPASLGVADFNDDGYADIVTANSSNASFLAGNGDGTFQSSTTVDAGPGNALAVGDFNGDGRPDFVVADYIDPTSGNFPGEVSVMLGKGDGTFAQADAGPVTLTPGVFAVAVGDFNHDGHLDMAIANLFDSTVTVLLGDGTGSFATSAPISVGSFPEGVAVGDFNGDGNLDIVTSNAGDGTLSVLFGDGAGNFGTPQTVSVGQFPGQIAVANFNGDKSSTGHDIQDIAIKSSTDNVVRILLGSEDAATSDNFANNNLNPLALPVADETSDPVTYPEGIVAGDFNGDGTIDLATANLRTNTVSVFLNLGNGQFADEQRFSIAGSGSTPFSIAAGDFNRDGFLDLATSNGNTNNVSILLGDGTGKFALPGRFGSANHSKAPLLVDLNGDGARDSVAIDAQGRILLRLGRPGQPGVFAPAVVVNAAQIAAGVSAADFALVNDGSQRLLAILNRATGQNSQNSLLSLYRFNGAGKPNLISTSSLGGHFDQIAAAKLDGNNRDDLVALDAAAGTITKFLRSGTGFVANGAAIPVGSAPSALLAANFGGSLDSLLIADSETGSIGVVSGGNSPVSYQGSGLAIELGSADPITGAAIATTFDGPTTLAVGNLNDLDDAIVDMIEVQTGTNTVSVLLGKSSGGFIDPQANQEIQTAGRPIAATIGKFNSDAHADLAVLEADGRVEIFLGDGHGNFQLGGSYEVGSDPAGLSVYKVNSDNKNDLMISSRSGDVVTLLGNGDGTFRPFTRAGQQMNLAVGSGGSGDVVVTNQSGDRIVAPGSQVSQRGDGVNAPTAVRLTDNLGNAIDLNGDGLPDMVVANSGGNDVLVYLGAVGGGYDLAHPLSFSTGSDPVDVEVADVNGDSKQDVVVTNYGSNDVSILLGTGDATIDTTSGKSNLLKAGVRLNVGQGPVSTQVVLQPGHTNPDLLVTNSISNSVYLLPSLGGGFFNDVAPTQFATGNTPVQTVVGNFNGQMGFVTINYASNSLTFYSSFQAGGAAQEISSGGSSPLTAISFGLNGDGTTNLIVGNNGNGVFSVFEGSQAGLSLVNSFTGDLLNHPAALAVTGQDQNLQLLALDEGDETVHVFNRDTINGENTRFLPAQTELANLGSGVFGLNTSGLNIVFSLISALGISVEGFLSTTSVSESAGGDGNSPSHPLVSAFFEDLGSALNSGHQWVSSALEGLGGTLGVHLDDQQVGAAVGDVMSLIFPHLPWQAIPTLIHDVLESASQKHPTAPLATDQAMEDFDYDLMPFAFWDAAADSTQTADNNQSTAEETTAYDAKSPADSETSAAVPRAGAPLDVAAGRGMENRQERTGETGSTQLPAAALAAPKNIAMNQRFAGADEARRVRALQWSLGLPVSASSAGDREKSSPSLKPIDADRGSNAELRASSASLLALTAVMGSIGGWARRLRRKYESEPRSKNRSF